MAEPHPHADLIEAVGRSVVRACFGLSKQGLQNWRMRGVPQLRRVRFVKLAKEHEVEVPADFLEEIGTL